MAKDINCQINSLLRISLVIDITCQRRYFEDNLPGSRTHLSFFRTQPISHVQFLTFPFPIALHTLPGVVLSHSSSDLQPESPSYDKYSCNSLHSLRIGGMIDICLVA